MQHFLPSFMQVTSFSNSVGSNSSFGPKASRDYKCNTSFLPSSVTSFTDLKSQKVKLHHFKASMFRSTTTHTQRRDIPQLHTPLVCLKLHSLFTSSSSIAHHNKLHCLASPPLRSHTDTDTHRGFTPCYSKASLSLSLSLHQPASHKLMNKRSQTLFFLFFVPLEKNWLCIFFFVFYCLYFLVRGINRCLLRLACLMRV